MTDSTATVQAIAPSFPSKAVPAPTKYQINLQLVNLFIDIHVINACKHNFTCFYETFNQLQRTNLHTDILVINPMSCNKDLLNICT